MGTGFSPRKPHNRPQHEQARAGVSSTATAGQLMKQAREAFYREDEDQALNLLLEALELAPQNLHAHYLAALCADLLSEEETLDDVCLHAIEIDRRHPYVMACEAVRYLYLSNFSRADDLFARALELLPDDLDLYLGLGILHEYSGEDGRSADAFQHALELDPNNVRARVSLGIAYAMSGEYQSAFAEYQKAKEIDPTIENPHQRLGRDYYLDGAIEEAASEFAQAVSEEPGEPAAYFYLMDCYNRMSRSDDALDMYETIRLKFGNDPENACGYYEYFHMHREAIAALETLVGRCPDDPDLRLRLAQGYKETGRLDDAVKEARTGAQLDPEDHHTHAFLGRLLFERGDCLSAAAACRRAVELNHYDQGAYVTLADSLLFLGRDEEAQKTVEEMEHNREQAWQRYRDKFGGGPGPSPDR